ncbi:hypothetical protein SDC9_33370 [bioreactor metagenome]|jgi:hypothetical protein|uniref:Uncharacterized protein n=1 Tax=bioreactor metagenome TaxID=1076179 RepID=A0A644V7R8_9ZZZZ
MNLVACVSVRRDRNSFAILETKEMRVTIHPTVYFMGMVEHGGVAVVSDEEQQ